MKEATGELNMTVITLIAVAAVAALFYFVMWPMIQRMIVQQTCNTYGSDWKAVPKGSISGATSSNATVSNWWCCPGDSQNQDECIPANEEAQEE